MTYRKLTEEEILALENEEYHQPLRAATGIFTALLFVLAVVLGTILIVHTIHYFNEKAQKPVMTITK